MSADLPQNWLEDCLSRLSEARVGVFGDFCLDAYWMVDSDEGEVSVETGLPVRRVRSQHYSLGGAGNVVANLADLGVGEIRTVGLIGDDLFGGLMLDLLSRSGADVGGMLRGREWQTPVYAKPCVGDRELNRIDFGAFNEVRTELGAALAEQLDRAADDCGAVILNQQIPGGVSAPEMMERINRLVAGHPQCVFLVDSRHRAESYRGAMLKLNAHEAARLCGRPRPLEVHIPAEAARGFAGELFRRSGRPIFLTRGERGIVVADEAGLHEEPGIEVVGAVDPVGAGDTVAAVLAAVLGSGGTPQLAARLANVAASVTVRKLQTTGTATPAEIRRAAAGR